MQGNYQSSKPSGFAPKQFKPSQFYGKPREPQLVPGTDGSLKPEIDCNYCTDLGHLKYNCPKLKEKEARMQGIGTITSLKRKTRQGRIGRSTAQPFVTSKVGSPKIHR